MTVVVVDSFGTHSAADLDAVGAIGTVGYLRAGNPSKAITRPQYDALLKAGKQIALVYERSDTDWQGGYNLGLNFGMDARKQASAFGFPHFLPIYCASFDFDTHPADLPVALGHMRGFRDGAGVASLYGTAMMIDACVAAGYCTKGWQSCSTGYYDNSRLSPHAALRQHCHQGLWYDWSDILMADWGQVPAVGGTPHAPAPAPKPVVHQLQGSNMKLTEVRIATDDHGRGWHPVCPFNTFVSVTPQGPAPAADGWGWAQPTARVQNRDGQALVTVTGGPVNGSVVVFVATTA